MKTQRLSQIFLISLFFIILIMPPASLPGLSIDFWQQLESQSSVFSLRNAFRNVMDFPSSFNNYFETHYFLHESQVDALETFRLRLLNEKEYPNVLIGKENWLYYTGEDNIRDFECTSPFSKKELDSLTNRLKSWDERLNQMGIDFYVLIAPNKESIYPQYLPDDIHSGWSACRIDQVMSAVSSTHLKVLYPFPSLISAAENSQVYHRTDTHWNDTGALLAVVDLLSLIRQNHPNIALPTPDQFIPETRTFSGDLASFIPNDPRYVEKAIFLTPSGGFQAKITQGENRTIMSRRAADNLPTALVFRDSFSDALIPFLADHFSSADYVHSFTVDFSLVEQKKPDIVILEIAQRYLGVLR